MANVYSSTTSMITVEGVPEAIALFNKLPRIVVSYALPQALGAASVVMRRALLESTPYTSLSMTGRTKKTGVGNWGRGALRENIITDIQIDSQLRGGTFEIGFGRLSPIARWVEWGHRMVSHKPGLKMLGIVPAYPFMRPAFDMSSDESIQKFVAELSSILSRGLPGLPPGMTTGGEGG